MRTYSLKPNQFHHLSFIRFVLTVSALVLFLYFVLNAAKELDGLTPTALPGVVKEMPVSSQQAAVRKQALLAEVVGGDLSKQTGDFFRYVFDHGTFYLPKWGTCDREFVQPKDGSPVYLETTYDVSSTASWVGMYFKIRNLDLSHYKTFRLEARQIPGIPAPEYTKIEFKSKAETVRVFAIKRIGKVWDPIDFPLRVTKAMPINEVIFIFANEKVGNNKEGGVQFRNFSLVAKSPEEIAAMENEVLQKAIPTRITTSASSKVPVVIGQNLSRLGSRE